MSFPLVIGVAGHRSILASRSENIRHEVVTFFKQVESHYPNVQIILASSLAEGADRLVAEIGLSRGYRLVVPLPFPESRFKEDFLGTIDEFEYLKQQACSVFVVDDENRDGYETASRWIAHHSHILLALWDGEQTIQPLPGGTEFSVNLRLNKFYSSRINEIYDYYGLVWHIDCPREENSSVFISRWLNEEGEYHLLCSNLKRLDEVNLEVRGICDNSDSQSDATPNLELAFQQVDVLASQYQSSYLSWLGVMVVVPTAMAVLMVTLSWGNIEKWLFGFLSIAFAFSVYWVKKKCIYEKYLEYRAFAEVLRIAIFWRKASVGNSVLKFFLAQHKGALSWIRDTVQVLQISDQMQSGASKMNTID